MKRWVVVLLTLGLIFLSACSGGDDEKKDKAEGDKGTKEAEQTEDHSIDVKKGAMNVEITLPASFFEGQDIDTLIASAEQEGITDIIENDDGSITYKMSKEKHDELLKQIQSEIDLTIEETKNSEDYISIKEITHNDAFTKFTVLVDQEAFVNSMDTFATFSLGMSGMMYQVYNGVEANDAKVTIYLKDETSQEVFDEIIFPDDLEENVEQEEK